MMLGLGEGVSDNLIQRVLGARWIRQFQIGSAPFGDRANCLVGRVTHLYEAYEARASAIDKGRLNGQSRKCNLFPAQPLSD